MRWPFRRSDPNESAPPAERSPDSAASHVVPAVAPAWTSLPPIQRTAEVAMPLTAPAAALVADVHERLTPAQALAPLGHEVGPLAPTGTIGLTATPIESAAAGLELVQRQVARPIPTAPMPATEPTAEPSDPALLPSPIAPRVVPVLDVPVAPGIQRSLTSAADTLPSTAGRDEASRSGDPLANVGEPAEPIDVTASPPAASFDPVVARSAASIADDSPVRDSASLGSDTGPRPAMPTVRRLGLGAPIGSTGAGPTIQRTSAAPTGATSVAESPGASTAPSTLGPPPRPADPAHSPTPPDRTARIPVQRYSLSDGLPLASTAHPGGEATLRDVPISEGPPMPLVSNPVRDPVSIQRLDASPSGEAAMTDRPRDDASSTTPATHDGDVAGSGPSRVTPTVTTGSVIVSRLMADGGSPPAMPVRSIRPVVGRGGDSLPIQRTGDAVPGLDRRDSVSISRASDQQGAVEPHLLVARTSDASDTLPVSGPRVAWSLEATPLGPAAADIQRASMPETQSVHLDLAGRRPVGGGTPRMDLQRDPEVAAAPGSAAVDQAIPSPAAAESAPEAPVGWPPDITIAREAIEDAYTGPTVQRASASGGGDAPTVGAGGSEKDLDELARRLYDRIRLRLTRELLVDRERAGALTDLR